MSNEFNRVILDKDEFEKRENNNFYLSEKNLNFVKDSFKGKIENGTLDLNELKKALRKYGINLDENDSLKQLFENAEKNGNYDIDFDQFIDMISSKLLDIYSLNELSKFFSLIIGEENTDKIDFQILRKLNMDLTDEEIMKLIKQADTDGDNKINFEDFYGIITKRI